MRLIERVGVEVRGAGVGVGTETELADVQLPIQTLQEECMDVDPYKLFLGQNPTTPVDWQAISPRRRGVGGS